ncbi:hypothetical protein [Gordoniibacillus kamchatkensis]|uniref:hypothetical protein n=1 Tax=Gordoniibacillus kamchatkensis TaxID=1590651 RepID=UPI0012E034F4|nr:hypothetical protein [Paenibacillus sp. VKM B-2647]
MRLRLALSVIVFCCAVGLVGCSQKTTITSFQGKGNNWSATYEVKNGKEANQTISNYSLTYLGTDKIDKIKYSFSGNNVNVGGEGPYLGSISSPNNVSVDVAVPSPKNKITVK